jgi:hypothetical protein
MQPDTARESRSQKGFVERLAAIDRRIIFVIIAVVVAVPVLYPIALPVLVSPPVQDLYNAIDALPPDSVIIMAIDFDPTSEPELYPAFLAVARHAFSKGLKIVALGYIAPGIPIGERGLRVAAEEYSKEYGVDYVNLGYKTGMTVALLMMGKQIRDPYPQDHYGTPVGELPLMRRVHSFRDIALAVDFAHGVTPDYWIAYAGARFGLRVGLCATGVMTSQYYPYYDSGQLFGLLGGLKGSSEYEALIGTPGSATMGMTAQSLAHLVIMAFIIIANLSYFIVRRRSSAVR